MYVKIVRKRHHFAASCKCAPGGGCLICEGDGKHFAVAELDYHKPQKGTIKKGIFHHVHEQLFECAWYMVNRKRATKEVLKEMIPAATQCGVIGNYVGQDLELIPYYEIVVDRGTKYFCFDCEIYVMNDDGKTIERYN